MGLGTLPVSGLSALAHGFVERARWRHPAGCRMCHKLNQVIEEHQQPCLSPPQANSHSPCYLVSKFMPQEIHQVTLKPT